MPGFPTIKTDSEEQVEVLNFIDENMANYSCLNFNANTCFIFPFAKKMVGLKRYKLEKKSRTKVVF